MTVVRETGERRPMATDRGIVNGLRTLGADQAADRLEQLLADNAALRARVVELEEEDLGATLDSDTLNRLVKVLMVPVEALRRFFPEYAPRRGLTKRCYRAFDGRYVDSETRYVFQLTRNWQCSERNFGAATLAALDEALLAYGREHGLELTRGMSFHKKTVEACERHWVATDPDYPLPVVERLLEIPLNIGWTCIFYTQRLRCLGDVVLCYGKSKDEEQRLFGNLLSWHAPIAPTTREFEVALAGIQQTCGLHLGMKDELPDYVLEQFARLREMRFGAKPTA